MQLKGNHSWVEKQNSAPLSSPCFSLGLYQYFL